MPKGFFPQQDNGTVFGGIQGAQDISFQAMQSLTLAFVNIIKSDPAVENVGGLYRRQRAGEHRIRLSSP